MQNIKEKPKIKDVFENLKKVFEDKEVLVVDDQDIQDVESVKFDNEILNRPIIITELKYLKDMSKLHNRDYFLFKATCLDNENEKISVITNHAYIWQVYRTLNEGKALRCQITEITKGKKKRYYLTSVNAKQNKIPDYKGVE